MPAIIRPASPTDAQAAKACVQAAFEIYLERMDRPPAPMLLDFPSEIEQKHVWLAEAEDKVVGVLVQYETGQGFYVDTVAVDPPHQGSGVGKILLQFAEQEARRRGLRLALFMHQCQDGREPALLSEYRLYRGRPQAGSGL
jgi:GNAT superfamily N-acetyltransferase